MRYPNQCLTLYLLDSPESIATTPQATSTMPGGNTGTQSPTPSSSQSSNSPTGAIVGGVVGGIVVAITALITWFYIRRRRRHINAPSGDRGAPSGTNSMYIPTTQMKLYVSPQCMIVKGPLTLFARTRLIPAHSPQTTLFTPTSMLPKADLLVYTAVSQNFSLNLGSFCCGLIFLVLTLYPPNAGPLAHRRCGREMSLIFKLIHAITEM